MKTGHYELGSGPMHNLINITKYTMSTHTNLLCPLIIYNIDVYKCVLLPIQNVAVLQSQDGGRAHFKPAKKISII